MFIDARTLDEGQSFSADICIVGAGPAGLTLALDLSARSGMRILLVESGSFEADSAVEALSQGTSVGDPYVDIATMRARRFAGAAAIWHTALPGSTGAKYVPLDPIDFEKRSWIPHSGWPLDYAQLVPWYEKAMKFCGVGPFQFSAQDWSSPDAQPWPLENTDVQSAAYQLSPDLFFTRDARATLAAAENVQCLLNATVVAVGASPPGSQDLAGHAITGLKARTLSGRSLDLRATLYVLAAGSIENARLLLAWGIGNQQDQVGRYYMDHPSQAVIDIVPADRSLFDRSAFYDRRKVRGSDIFGRLVLTRAAMEREKLLNLALMVFPRPAPYRWRAVDAVWSLKRVIRNRTFTLQSLRYLFRAAIGAPWIVDYVRRRRRGEHFISQGWSQWRDNAHSYRIFTPTFNLEQAPDPDNRITLGPTRDALGIPQPIIHWKWRDLDRRSVTRAVEIFDAAFRQAGLGHCVPSATPGFLAGNHHPAGTTRMSDDPRNGVVDAAGKVHGLSNLFVNGPSVFPTCGYANPTLTNVALSLRLADHLAQSVRR
ncbi:MAG TPA: GMC family oxidoreductase [Tepidisphaeraceae bacterium]|nr:GMC family oxidoreductase [Tepidisphaeraceae bacterium]